jgi:hypothetical protein
LRERALSFRAAGVHGVRRPGAATASRLWGPYLIGFKKRAADRRFDLWRPAIWLHEARSARLRITVPAQRHDDRGVAVI